MNIIISCLLAVTSMFTVYPREYARNNVIDLNDVVAVDFEVAGVYAVQMCDGSVYIIDIEGNDAQ